MSSGQNETPVRGQAQPGHNGRLVSVAGTCTLAKVMGHAKRAGMYHITLETGDTFTFFAKGRVAWALDRLRAAGLNGCTFTSDPAPRWAAYVYCLRRIGVPIQSLREPHGGKFPGTHARYILRADVQKVGSA